MTILLAVAALAGPVQADGAPRARPEILTRLVECRALADAAERLACYDQHVPLFDDAERRRDLVVVDRNQVREARRGLFGLTLPRFRLFEGDGKSEPAFTELETRLTGAQQVGGRWRFTLEDGANWVQTDSEEVARTPRPGQSIRIRRGALGSFLANVERQPAIRVKRVN